MMVWFGSAGCIVPYKERLHGDTAGTLPSKSKSEQLPSLSSSISIVSIMSCTSVNAFFVDSNAPVITAYFTKRALFSTARYHNFHPRVDLDKFLITDM